MPAPDEYGLSDPSSAPAAALMADRARAAMLTALLGGRALAAGELARLAGVQPSTASAHLARLLDGGLVTVTSRGRQRYYSLAGHEVAAAIEALSQLGPVPPVRTLRQSRQAAALAGARTCYDHLAGRAGVAMLDGLLARGFLCATPIPGEPPTTAHPAGTPPTSTPPPTSTRPGNGHTATGHPAAFDVTQDGTAALAACGVRHASPAPVTAPVRGQLPGLDRAPGAPGRGAGCGADRPDAAAGLDRARGVPPLGPRHLGGPVRPGRHVRLARSSGPARPRGGSASLNPRNPAAAARPRSGHPLNTARMTGSKSRCEAVSQLHPFYFG